MSYYETERDNRVIEALKDIANVFKRRSDFIEVYDTWQDKVLVNKKYISWVRPCSKDECYIYLALPDSQSPRPDFDGCFKVKMPYEELVKLIGVSKNEIDRYH